MQLLTMEEADAILAARRDFLENLSPNESENLSLVKKYLQNCMTAVRKVHEARGAGHEVVALRTLVVDDLLKALFDLAGREYCLKYPTADHKSAVVAIGGYGRGELSPASDIDIMFLYPWKITPYLETVVERVLYALWDSGLDVGYSTRNISDCIKISSDLVAKTSLIDSRYLCGDQSLFDEYKKAIGDDVFSKNVDAFIRNKIEEADERRIKYGGSVYILEPDIKEGDGGLRDLHTALWAAKIKFKVEDFKELNQKGIINDREFGEIMTASNFMLRVRNELHFQGSRKSDQLTFDLQEKIATSLGYSDQPDRLAVEQLMRDYYLTASNIKEISEIVLDRCLESNVRRSVARFVTKRDLSYGFKLFGGEITLSDKDLFKKDPRCIMRLFELSQTYGAPIRAFAADALRESLDHIDDDFRALPEVNESFLNILKSEWDVTGTLRLMHKFEVLGRYIPEFGKVNCQVQHDLYHIYTVDIHSLFAVEELRRLSFGEYKEQYPVRTALMEEVEKPELLYLAALLHDVGKGKGGKHEEVGAGIADRVARRIGFSENDAKDIVFLVLKHLRLSHTAQRRDLTDPKLILDFAREMETLERLKMLYLLTFADIKAIGPDVWTEWKSALFLDLYTKTAAVFERGTFEIEEIKEKIAAIYKEVESSLVDDEIPKEVATAFLDSMPERYLLSTTPLKIVEHMKVAGRFREPLTLDITHNEARKHTKLIVVTLDVPGLFSWICGVLAANGIGILNAKVFSRSGGEVLDVFHVEGEGGGVVSEKTKWEKVENDLLDVIQGVRKITDVVKRKKSSILKAKYKPHVKTRIIVDNETSDSHTVIEVFAQDKLGLLYVITSTLSKLRIYTDVAKISTMGEQVTDVFYVKDSFGQKIFYDVKLDEMKAKLEKAVEKWVRG